MNKKILAISILAVFTLMVISFTSAVSYNTTTTIKKKETPLFNIRTRLAIGEKISQIIQNIKIKFLSERIFFLPMSLIYLRIGDDLPVRYIPLDKLTIEPCHYTNWPVC